MNRPGGGIPLTAVQAICLILLEYPDDGRVMAQNYDANCPNDDDHQGDGTCHCWDGLTLTDVDGWTLPDGWVWVDQFAEWGPFEYWPDPQ